MKGIRVVAFHRPTLSWDEVGRGDDSKAMPDLLAKAFGRGGVNVVAVVGEHRSHEIAWYCSEGFGVWLSQPTPKNWAIVDGALVAAGYKPRGAPEPDDD